MNLPYCIHIKHLYEESQYKNQRDSIGLTSHALHTVDSIQFLSLYTLWGIVLEYFKYHILRITSLVVKELLGGVVRLSETTLETKEKLDFQINFKLKT